MAEITIRISDRFLRVAGAIIVGIFALWVISYLWSSGVFRPKYRLRMYVNETAGLSLGAPVRVDGVEVGKVESVNLARNSNDPDAKIELILRLERRYQDQILSDSIASLAVEGLLGNRYINIQRGARGAPLADNAQILAIPNKEFKEINLGNLSHSLSKLADCMKEVENPPQSANPAKASDSAKVPK